MRFPFALLFAGALLVSSLGVASASPTKDWTVLVFLNGNNNLDSFGTLNLTQMEKVGSTAEINIVVQWASYAATTTKRLLIHKSTDPNQVTSPVVQEFPRVDMGDPQVLRDFIHWGVQNYPAKHYFIDVWDHGAGWHRYGMHSRDISFDELSGHSISTEALADAMADAASIIGHPVDIYGSDACMMAMAEVASQMEGSVNVFVGSEETEPGAGWPYDAFLARWAAQPTLTAGEIGSALAEEYVKSFQTGSSTSEVTFSAIDMAKYALLENALSAWASDLQKLSAADQKKFATAAFTATSFAYNDYTDIGDMVDQVQATGLLSADRTSAVKQALVNAVVSNHTTHQYTKAQGISIWLPKSKDTYDSYSARYQALKFQAHTGWGSFLGSMVNQLGY